MQTDSQEDVMAEKFARHIAVTLRDARQAAGLSARELARRVGTSHPTILAYEAGRKVPLVTTMMRILHACGYAVDITLSPRLRGDPAYPKGDELMDVLELAAQFPARHDRHPDARLPI